MEAGSTPPTLVHDVNFVVGSDGYEIWFADRIAEDRPALVDQFADWLEDDVGALNLGQVDHRTVLADGLLSDRLKRDILGWWAERVDDLDRPSVGERPG
jgi:hypothetical protein